MQIVSQKTMAIKKENKYDLLQKSVENFRNLNLEVLRGLLALIVLGSHIELLSLYFGRSDNYLNPIIFHIGRVAVTGFFVLSGYLISLSILRNYSNGKFTFKKFFIRRIFRIIPLYFIVILSATFVFPSIDILKFIVPDYAIDVRVETHFLTYFFLLLPQIPLLNNAILPFAEPSWSIGVEEIFYLLIPFVIVLFRKKILTILILSVLIILISKYSALYYFELPQGDKILNILSLYRYDAIALGCILGVLHFTENKLFFRINKLHFLISLIALIYLMATVKLSCIDYFPFALCFSIIIAFLSNHQMRLNIPKWLSFTGTISYSLYMTHELSIVFLMNLNVDQISPVLHFILSISCSILVAALLYYTIEQPFVKIGQSLIKENKQSEAHQ